MIPRIAKWILRDENIYQISDLGFRTSDFKNSDSLSRPKSEIRNPKSEIVLPSFCLCLLLLGLFCCLPFGLERLFALERRSRTARALCGFDQPFCGIGIGAGRF